MGCEKDWAGPAGFEDGRRSRAKEWRQLLETRKDKGNRLPPRTSRKEHGTTDDLD